MERCADGSAGTSRMLRVRVRLFHVHLSLSSRMQDTLLLYFEMGDKNPMLSRCQVKVLIIQTWWTPENIKLTQMWRVFYFPLVRFCTSPGADVAHLRTTTWGIESNETAVYRRMSLCSCSAGRTCADYTPVFKTQWREVRMCWIPIYKDKYLAFSYSALFWVKCEIWIRIWVTVMQQHISEGHDYKFWRLFYTYTF